MKTPEVFVTYQDIPRSLYDDASALPRALEMAWHASVQQAGGMAGRHSPLSADIVGYWIMAERAEPDGSGALLWECPAAPDEPWEFVRYCIAGWAMCGE